LLSSSVTYIFVTKHTCEKVNISTSVTVIQVAYILFFSEVGEGGFEAALQSTVMLFLTMLSHVGGSSTEGKKHYFSLCSACMYVDWHFSVLQDIHNIRLNGGECGTERITHIRAFQLSQGKVIGAV
jgi:hypothetical protein